MVEEEDVEVVEAVSVAVVEAIKAVEVEVVETVAVVVDTTTAVVVMAVPNTTTRIMTPTLMLLAEVMEIRLVQLLLMIGPVKSIILT